MIPGMRNFFMAKVGQGLAAVARSMSPLDIHHAAGDRLVQTINRTLARNRTVWNMTTSKPSVSEAVAGYFKGYSTSDFAAQGGVAENVLSALGMAPNMAARRVRQRMRAGVFGTLGAVQIANWTMGENNAVSQTASFAARAGFHTGVAYGAMKAHPLAGTAYMGATVINAFRRGDNLGPF